MTMYTFDFYTADQDPTQSSTCEQSEVHRLVLFQWGFVSTDVMISPVGSWLAFCFLPQVLG